MYYFMHRFDFDHDKCSNIHFIGIGGISMSGLAQLMITRGYKVTGSDRCESHITKKLEAMGATVYCGHDGKNIEGADLVVHTAAVHDDNPEIIAAKANNIRLIDRAEFLGAVMKQFSNAVGVSGTHGKTTTTGMLAYAMLEADAEPTVSIGGELDIIDGNFKVGSEDVFITEACEYTNSFLKFYPTVALITNIEEDHLDFFSGIEEIRESFRNFALLACEKGYVIANGEDENVEIALSGVKNVLTYGLEKNDDYYADNIVYKAGYPEFDVMHEGKVIAHIILNVPGEHNILNAVGTIAVCDVLKLDIEKAAEGVSKFHGTKRRFEKKGMCGGAVVIDDYAHHPTEIKATLKAANDMPHNRICCIFQPHTYTRTKTLWESFLTSFDGVDKLILTDIYAAREKFDGVTTSEKLAGAIKEQGIDAEYADSFESAAKMVKEYVSEGDIVFTMGAGTITDMSDYLI